MDVQCQACSTEFEFDDSRVTARGVRVKCTDCGHMFTVRKRSGAVNKGGTPPPRQATGGAARSSMSLATSLAAVAPRTRSERAIRPRVGPPGRSSLDPAPSSTAGASGVHFPDLSEQRQLSRPWMVRSVDQDVVSFRDMSTLQKWIMEGRNSQEDELSRTGATWRSLGDISELDSMFRVQHSVSEGRRQSARPPAPGRPVPFGAGAAAAGPPSGRTGSAFSTEQSLPPPPPRPTGSAPVAIDSASPADPYPEEPPEVPTAPEEEAVTNPEHEAFTSPEQEALSPPPSLFDDDDDAIPTPRPGMELREPSQAPAPTAPRFPSSDRSGGQGASTAGLDSGPMSERPPATTSRSIGRGARRRRIPCLRIWRMTSPRR